MTTSRIGMQPMSLRALASTKPQFAQLLSDLNDHVRGDDLLGQWPFPLGNRHLVFVVRQWIQEEPSETLANLMMTDRCWTKTTSRYHELWLKTPPDPLPKGYQLLNSSAELLALRQMPVTPATIGYTLAQIVGNDRIGQLPTSAQRLMLYSETDRSPLPARGTLLTTLVFAALMLREGDEQVRDDDDAERLVQPNAELQLSGDMSQLTGPFVREELARGMLTHRDFVRSLAQHPFTEISAVRSAQPGSFKSTAPEDAFDYIKEVRREAQSQVDTLRQYDGSWQLDGAIKRIFDRVHKRVSQRRKRAGHPTAPPKRWRAEAERLIREDLRD
ncbi:MAG: hypothetical protein ACR2OE_13535 [Thermomicrobiales bacterium]